MRGISGMVYKRCGCKSAVTDETGAPVIGPDGKARRKELGRSCPQLRRTDGRWNPRHGSWWFLLQLPPSPEGRRRHLRQGGLASQEEAEARLKALDALLELSESADDPGSAREEIIASIRAALADRKPLPDAAQVGRRLALGQPVGAPPLLGPWLLGWLKSKKNTVRGNTWRSYESHVRLYLIPHLGTVRVDRLRVAAVRAMFTAIDEANEQIVAANGARAALKEAALKAYWAKDHVAARIARDRLGALPAHRRPAFAASQQAIRRTLRAALTDAQREHLVEVNVAKLVQIASGATPKPLVWTAARVAAWHNSGRRPAPVMVWTAEQTARFLRYAGRDRLGALFYVMAYTGMRRGEACGLRWCDVDLETRSLTIAQQIVQLGWATAISAPKTDHGQRLLPLGADTAAEFRAQRRRQSEERLKKGPGWVDTGLVFTNPDGTPLHPAAVTDLFTRMVTAVGLPPVRLHDLRHGAATHALAADVEPKAVSEMLGHSSVTFTLDVYTSVVEEVQQAAAETLAGVFNRAGARPARRRRT